MHYKTCHYVAILEKYYGWRLQALIIIHYILLTIFSTALKIWEVLNTTLLNIIIFYYFYYYFRLSYSIQTDLGTENSNVAFLQPILRHNDSDDFSGSYSHRYGRSTSNQVFYQEYNSL